MLGFPLTLRLKLPVVDGIQQQRSKFATGVENEATGVSKRNDSPAPILLLRHNFVIRLWVTFNEEKLACVPKVSKTYAKGTKLRASAKILIIWQTRTI